MSIQSVLAPVFVQVAMVMVLGFLMSWRRRVAIKGARLTDADIALGQNAWPARAAQAGNSYSNQFELPVLFFALVPLVLITHKADLVFVMLEWLFVILRIAHAAVHTTSNNLALRGPLFLAGVVVLAIAWALFAVAILAS